MERTHLSLKVLVVESEPEYVLFVQKALQRSDLTTFEMRRAETLATAIDSLAEEDFHVVLLDLKLPDSDGLATLAAICGRHPEIPVVVLTDNRDETLGMEAVVAGAQDYLHKSDLGSRTVERVLRYAVQRLELQAANELLDQKNQQMKDLCETAHQFVDNVSHEFRTPLTVIKEFASIMCDGLAGQITAEQRDFLNIINDRVDDLAIMVDDMLDVSKLEAGLLSVWRRESHVRDVIQHVRPALERKAALKKVQLEIALEDDLPTVYCDPDKVGRVVINLAINAIKFCGDGGTVKLWARRGTDTPDVAIGVTDDGPGISPEDVKTIFDRFSQASGTAQASTQGFGLGLNIAKELVELNLGEIHLQSQPGKGTTFWFTVPQWQPQEVLARHVQRLAQMDDGPGYATLISITVDSSAAAGLSGALDEFFQHTFRGNDIVLPVLPQKWLVVAACHAREADKMIARVQAVRAEANRNRIRQPLPDFEIRTVGTWQIRTQAEDLIRQFHAELSSQCPPTPAPSVLVVDDDRDTLRGLQIRLSAAGYDVLTATDGQEAIDSAVQHLPNAILMDKLMPGMDGVTALGQLVQHPATKNIPVIMLSASLRDQQRTLEQGARFFLQKPCSTQTLLTVLSKVIKQPHPTGATRK